MKNDSVNTTNRTINFFKGVSVQTLVTLLMGVMEILVFAIMSRLLTRVDFGYFAAISGIIAIFMSISEAGLGSSIIQKKDICKSFISTAFSWSLILGVLIQILVMLLAPTLSNLIVGTSDLITPLRIMSFTILLNSIISVGQGLLYRELKFLSVGRISIISYVLASVVSVLLAFYGFGLWAVIALPVTNAVLSMMQLLFTVKYPSFFISKNDTKEIIGYSGWLTLGVIVNNLTHQLDKLLLPKLLSVQTLGAYNRPVGFISTISSKINNILTQSYSQCFQIYRMT